VGGLKKSNWPSKYEWVHEMKNSNELWWYWVKVIEGEQYYTHTLVNAAAVIKVLASTSASQVNF
jgi:hypothetical protein